MLSECCRHGLVEPSEVFVDATHVKASANINRKQQIRVHEEALFYEERLEAEINADREAHGKDPLKPKDGPPKGDGGATGTREIKGSITDPESGWFHKGEHKQVFAYSIGTACDRNGWVLGYTVSPGNLHDSRTFKGLYDRIRDKGIERLVADAGYKTPAIAKLLIDDGIEPVFPYTRPMTKDGFFRKHEYVYDEHYDCHICPENRVLKYSTTNREGYREYKSCPDQCGKCPSLEKCTHSRNHVKIVTRHVWEDYIEKCEDIRHTMGMNALYKRRKETIERIFGTAKEAHGFRYTTMKGNALMRMKVGLTYACINLKKLARILYRKGKRYSDRVLSFSKYPFFNLYLKQVWTV